MIGQLLGHYRIEAQLGSGGMGVVFRAHDERLLRKVALKLVTDTAVASATERVRLLEEARAASALNHPAIATVHEISEHGDQLFIVMELIEGRTLRSLLVPGGADLKSLTAWGMQLADGLACAHAQGIVHGDVKPENVIVQPDGRVKLLDFGIARRIAQTMAVTLAATETPAISDAQALGTIPYMAPEQLRGLPTDARTDLFSLGVVLFELAAGHRPFPGPTTTAFVWQILNEPTPALTRPDGIVPRELSRIVRKLLEKDAALRYQTARDLHVDLVTLGRELETRVVLPSPARGTQSVAVLPFALLTPNPHDEYLSVALADAMINQLSAAGEILVRPTSTVMRYARQAVDPLIAGRELNVHVVIDGSIQKLGRRVRVHVQARDVASGTTKLSARHDADEDDLFGLQDRLADDLSRALGVAASGRAPEKPTDNPEAYELFLRGKERLSRMNRWDTRTAIDMFEAATKMDPKFADAWALLGAACWRYGVSFDPTATWMRRTETATRRALALNPDHADALGVRATLFWSPYRKFDNRAALETITCALGSDPRNALAIHWHGSLLTHLGFMNEAIGQIDTLLVSNPGDTNLLDSRAQAAFFLGDYEEAEAFLARAIAIDSTSFYPNLDRATLALYRNQLDAAAERIRTASRVASDERWIASLEGLLWAKRGDARKADAAIARAVGSGKIFLHTHHVLHYAAAACAVLGRSNRAVSLLKKATQTGLPNYPLFVSDPHFKPLAADPKFRRLMADLKRTWERYRKDVDRSLAPQAAPGAGTPRATPHLRSTRPGAAPRSGR